MFEDQHHQADAATDTGELSPGRFPRRRKGCPCCDSDDGLAPPQVYQNQFQKYNPEPFVEKDIEPTIMSDDGPIAAPGVCRAALQRSVGKILYHTGFEEYQPSALDTITDIASDFFARLVRTIGEYRDAPKVPVPPAADGTRPDGPKWQSRYTNEEGVMHTFYENGVDIESIEAYAKDDIERLSSKLGVMHERMKAHLTDLLVSCIPLTVGPLQAFLAS